MDLTEKKTEKTRGHVMVETCQSQGSHALKIHTLLCFFEKS